MRAIQLYAQGVADAVIDGKASIPEVPTGDDEFVELDEAGRPKVEAAPKGRGKKAATKKRARVTKKPARAPAPAPEAAAEAAAAAAPAEAPPAPPEEPKSRLVAEAEAEAEEAD